MEYSEICDAIRSFKKLKFSYDGGERIVEPHCHGVTHLNNPALRAYQTDGYSKSGDTPAWRMFNLNEAGEIRVLDEEFNGPRFGYKRGDKGMKNIYCEL